MNQNTEFIPYARPEFGPEEEEAVLRVLRGGWLTSGPECRAFEEEFAARIGSSHAVSVSSATAGLHLALQALGIQKGDRVAVPTYTFTATAEVVHYLGAEPVLVDCAPGSFLMDVSVVEDRLRKDSRSLQAVIPVHFGGWPCFPEFWSWVRERGVKVVEDCAHAFPVQTPHGHVGNLGDAGVFSFYANKTITTGEGGMVVTADPDLARRIRVLRLHGIDRDAFQRFQSRTPAWFYDVVDVGYKYNLPDVLAAIGRIQLRRAEALKSLRRDIARFYLDHADALPGWIFPDDSGDSAWHLFPALCPEAEHRDLLVQRLFDAGVGTSVHYIPLHRLSFWRRTLGVTPADFPVAESLWQREISLPIGPGLTVGTAKVVLDRLTRVHREVYGRP